MTHTPLAGERLQPLGHLSGYAHSKEVAMLHSHELFCNLHVARPIEFPSNASKRRGHKPLRYFSTLSVFGLFAFDALVDLFPVDCDFLGCVNTNANLIAFDAEHRYGDIVANHEGFTYSAGKNQHPSVSMFPIIRSRQPLPILTAVPLEKWEKLFLQPTNSVATLRNGNMAPL